MLGSLSVLLELPRGDRVSDVFSPASEAAMASPTCSRFKTYLISTCFNIQSGSFGAHSSLLFFCWSCESDLAFGIPYWSPIIRVVGLGVVTNMTDDLSPMPMIAQSSPMTSFLITYINLWPLTWYILSPFFATYG